MNQTRFLLLFFCCWLGAVTLQAKPFLTIDSLTSENEAIQGRISFVVQDKTGFIWFSSFNGLHKYDGYTIRKFKSEPGTNSCLVTNRIDEIVVNSQNDLWCQSASRIYLFRQHDEQFIDVQKALEKKAGQSVSIADFFTLSNGATWMIGLNGLCLRVNDTCPLDSCQSLNLGLDHNHDVFDIHLDQWGREWILTKNGTFLYGRKQAISTLPFRFLFETGLSVWLTTASGVMAVHTGTNKRLTALSFPQPVHLIYHQVLSQDSLLVTATDQGLYLTNTTTRTTRLLSPLVLERVYRDTGGRIWGVAPDRRIHRLSEDGVDKVIPLPLDCRFSDTRVTFRMDDTGLMWLLFYETGGILYFDEAHQSFRYPKNSHKGQGDYHGFFVDKQGSLWYRQPYTLHKVTCHNVPVKLDHRQGHAELRSMMTDDQGRLWLGFKNGDICLYDNQDKFIGRLHPDGRISSATPLFGASAYCLYHDSKRRIWIGTREQGLYLLEPTDRNDVYKIVHYNGSNTTSEGLRGVAVYSITEDSYGQIWIGTYDGGLNLWQEGRFRHADNGLGRQGSKVMPQAVRFVGEVAPGVVMVGSKEGLFVFDARFDLPESLILYHNVKGGRPGSLSDNDVMYVYPSGSGALYVATNSGGVDRVLSDNLLSDNLRFETLTRKQGLASDIAFSLIEDALGRLWIISSDAFTRLDPDTGSVDVFRTSQLGYPVLLSEAMPLYRNGLFYVGTLSGLLTLDPLALTKRRYQPPLVLTDLLIQNQPALKRLREGNQLTLKSNERNLTLHFAALDFQRTTSIRYAYYLEDVDEHWTETDENRITYLNLPKGKHVLHLKSTNGDGIWVNNELLVSLYVKPRFFEQFWGYLVMVIMALLLLWMVFELYHRFYNLRHRLKLEQQMTDIKLNFFTDISHELRTPLTLIDGPVSEVLEDTSLTPRSRHYLELVQSNARRMLNMVNQILDFRKLQHNKMSLLLEQLDIRVLLEEVMEQFEELAHQHRLSLSLIQTSSDLDSLWLDRDKVEKLFFNLLANAIKYTPDGKAITVTVAQHDDGVSVTVADEGQGIPRERLEDIFQRFETVVKSNLFKTSSGLGLSLVKQFADLHHATVTVDSEEQKGSRFTIAFKHGKAHFEGDMVDYLVDDGAESRRPSGVQLLQKEPAHEVEKTTVLVVEDNPDLRDFIRNLLSDQFHVVEANDGAEGLQAAKMVWPDLIISDVVMPAMDGFELVSRVKADPDIYHIPVILLTAKAGVESRIKGVELGADDYVMKPFSANYLRARVNALIEQRRHLRLRLLESLSEKAGGQTALSLEPSLPHITPADEVFVQKVMAFMETNMDNAQLTIAEFAEALNLGRSVFTNKLKAILGLTPVEFVQEMRLKRARQLLDTRNFTIMEVAYQTGFNDPKYFSLCFKKYYGMRPSVYLKQSTEVLDRTDTTDTTDITDTTDDTDDTTAQR
jgi:signal transduction histidine kinase/DNA-binding response OmpR family regulator/ligand-binding sensor domain-containing protein